MPIGRPVSQERRDRHDGTKSPTGRSETASRRPLGTLRRGAEGARGGRWPQRRGPPGGRPLAGLRQDVAEDLPGAPDGRERLSRRGPRGLAGEVPGALRVREGFSRALRRASARRRRVARGLSGVMVLYSDEESFTYMTPEGHPFSGWITFSAYEKADGVTTAQAHLLIRANDPLYELMMPLGLHKIEDRTWQRTLKNVAAHFGTNGEVETRVVCVDPKRQWRRYENIRYNALILSVLHAITAPLRWIGRQATSFKPRT